VSWDRILWEEVFNLVSDFSLESGSCWSLLSLGVLFFSDAFGFMRLLAYLWLLGAGGFWRLAALGLWLLEGAKGPRGPSI
jgi:hypothetical protein